MSIAGRRGTATFACNPHRDRRAKPKKTVKFNGHEYAYFDESVTWHVAKKYCEEMGGHLIILENSDEAEFLKEWCRRDRLGVWIGATDEDLEGTWHWVDGTKATFNSPHITKGGSIEHYMTFEATSLNDFNDTPSSRTPLICEWDH
jgi:hypothetical protein